MQMWNQPSDTKSASREKRVKAKPSDIGGKKNKTFKIQHIPQGCLAKVLLHCLVLNKKK